MQHSGNTTRYTRSRFRRWWPKRWRKSSGATRQRERLPYRSRETLLSRGEAAFFGPLQRAVNGEFLIMSKVRLADLVSCSATEWRTGYGGAISQKHVDFVLCDPSTTRFILAIELDDRTHDSADRKRRDRFLNEVLATVGIRLLRVRAKSYYSLPSLRSLVHEALQKLPS